MAMAEAEGTAASGPTVLRMLLGAHLRRLREAKGITREDAGWEIRASDSKISRMELGRVGFKERDVADLLTLYGVDRRRPSASALLDLARRGQHPRLVAPLRRRPAAWFQSYLGLESAAAADPHRTRCSSSPACSRPRTTPGRSCCSATATPRADEIDRRVDLRMERQQLLSRADPPQLWVVVDEAVLRRPIGGPTVMREPGRRADRRRPSCPTYASRSCRSPPAGTPPPGGAFTHPALPRPGPARRRLRRAAHQRALPRQARRRRPVRRPRWSGSASRPSRPRARPRSSSGSCGTSRACGRPRRNAARLPALRRPAATASS